MRKEQSLKTLLGHLPSWHGSVTQDVQITGISLDSREVEPGHLFVAIQGGQVDGHDYIPDAVKNGAGAVVGSRPGRESEAAPVPYLSTTDSRQSAAILSAAYYGFPGLALTVIGVTGTDGKTTTTNLIFHILREAGIPTGMISTVNAVIGDKSLDTGFHVTTPQAPDVQRYLRKMVDAGLTHVVIEATSHGLAQKRVDASYFDLAVVTNITHEHLDYHGNYAAYRDAKARLLDLLQEAGDRKKTQPRCAILNRDDSSYSFLIDRVQKLGLEAVTYGLQGGDVQGEVEEHSPDGIEFTVLEDTDTVSLTTSLVGRYNVYNCLAAVAACRSVLQLPWESIQRGVDALGGIPGRMEEIEAGQTFTVIVDFAHTPNALRRALTTARELSRGRVIAVFGSAGLRDREKRRLMAEISGDLADLTVLTAEDPRTESLDDILQEMATGIRSRGAREGHTFWRVPDRGQAIRKGIEEARRGDVVIICGKGHEQSMCFGETEYPWDDRQATRAALAAYLGQDGPDMPYLPTQD